MAKDTTVETLASLILATTPRVNEPACTFTPLTVNGHSISAINPELVFTGGMATLAMA